MTTKQILDTTSNRSVYNRSRKEYLEKKGKIHCAWCRYHGGENSTKKWYHYDEGEIGIRPNWKLVSKNHKQWMEKPKTYKIRVFYSRWIKKNIYEIVF